MKKRRRKWRKPIRIIDIFKKQAIILSLSAFIAVLSVFCSFAEQAEPKNNASNNTWEQAVVSQQGENESEKQNTDRQNDVPQTGDGAVACCLAAAICLSAMAFILSPKLKGECGK